MIDEELKVLLDAEIDPKRIHPPPKGKFGDYLESWDVIETANRLFGYDGWSFSVDSVEERTAVDKDGVVNGNFIVVKGTVSALGVTRQDLGSNDVSYWTADGWQTSYKGAVSDCLKRCLRTFGNQFGNSLYDKDRGLTEAKPSLVQQARNLGVKVASNPQDAQGYVLDAWVGDSGTLYTPAQCPDHPKRDPAYKEFQNRTTGEWFAKCTAKVGEGWCTFKPGLLPPIVSEAEAMGADLPFQ